MNYDDHDISEKSQLTALLLCLFLGTFGAHRFYVGKIITGIVYLLLGSTTLVYHILGFNYGFLVRIAFILFLIVDIYALYSDSFTDRKGRLVISKSKALVYETLAERDRILFEDKLNKLIMIALSIALCIVYFIVVNFVI